ncbi:MAG: bioB [Gammaproteobacteria bacterium]|jgi:biotin synthase|nr:bioB [Gammaproteobacteria bacterium]
MNNTAWTKDKIRTLYEKPFFELVHQAYSCHKINFDTHSIEFCTLSSIKTGNCPEDCAYCPQSGHYKTDVRKEKLLDVEEVLLQAQRAKNNGAKRFCMGAAWRSPPAEDFLRVLEIVKAVKSLGIETCVTLGMLDADQAHALKEAGLNYYNHNLDTSADYYASIITTRTYQDRINTITNIVSAGINVCCGGILGMGESRNDRIDFLLSLYELPSIPQSIPINQLIAIPGTPLQDKKPLDSFEFIKTLAITRIMFPQSKVRLSAGRENMSEEMQAWCFMAGANSIFIGEKLLTAKNPAQNKDVQLLEKLNICPPQKISSNVD